jgi:uncharacterized protein
MKLFPLFAATAALVAACASTPVPAPKDLFPDLEREQIAAETPTGTHRFTVWIADDDRSRARGLMFVRELPADHGMLFLFGKPRFVSFWMKDTPLPLDLVFIDAEGMVVNVAAEATPHSLEPIESEAPVTAVLELAGGTAGRIKLSRGSRIRDPFYGVAR